MDAKPLVNEVIFIGVTSGKNPGGAKSWTCKHYDNNFTSTYTPIHAQFLGPQLGKNSDMDRCKAVFYNHEELDRIRRKVQDAKVKGDFCYISFVIILFRSNYFLCYYIYIF